MPRFESCCSEDALPRPAAATSTGILLPFQKEHVIQPNLSSSNQEELLSRLQEKRDSDILPTYGTSAANDKRQTTSDPMMTAIGTVLLLLVVCRSGDSSFLIMI
mmetsp:Transcript_26447/g.72725  ORF Transcript_26447/g.72725 Transcript_26447/m.72725 type:complete len:104 (-) Transcript_26447:454-765(-)